MKTNQFLKPLLTSILFIFLMFGVKSSASAQNLGYQDSTNSCVNLSSIGYVYWVGLPGTYVGDTLNIFINWGDGNIDAYPNNYIYALGANAYVNLTVSHTYTAGGNYYISITAQDLFSYSQTIIDSIMVNTLCGSLYGNVLLDDGDGVYEWGIDLWASGVPVILTSSLNSYGTLTDVQGNYYISNIDHTATTYNVAIDPAWLTANGFSVLDPVGGSYDFTSPPLSYPYFPFLLDCSSATYADASVSGYGWGFVAGLSTGFIDICINSFSCGGVAADIDLSVSFDPMLTVASSDLPGYSVVGNTVTSSLTGINGLACYRIYFYVPVGTPAFTPLVFNINTNVTNYSDSYIANNQYTINSEVLNSWDPNDKSTNLAQNIDANATEEIYYNIRFQNMGNSPAINVIITDTIDSQFDLSSFRLNAQSHSGSYSIDNATRVVTFTFPNIMLPPQSSNDLLSQGFVRYNITENAGLPIGSVLNNTAYIDFDGNPLIITNTTVNVNTPDSTVLGVGNQTNNPSIVIYPQPASSFFYLSGINTETIKTISVLDANGKAIMKMTEGLANDGIYIGHLAAGMYFVTIETTESTTTQKLCIQR